MNLEDSLILNTENMTIFNVSNVSWWNNTDLQEYYIWLPGIGIAVVYAIIITIGLLGNVTLMKICICVKSMRTVPNLLMSSLALGDLLLLVTCAPVDACRYLVDQWLFGRVGCKLIPFIQLTSVGVSVFTLTALSFDRYKAIVKSMDIQRSRVRVNIRFQATAIWLLSMTLATPEAIFSDLHTFHISETNQTFVTCAPYDPHEVEMHPKIHSMAFFMVFYLIPLLMISVSYAFIAHRLMRSTVDIPVARHLHSSKQFDSRKRLSKTVLVFVGLFSVCWLPTHVIYLHRSYHYGQVDTSMAHFVASVCARILAFTNSCVNPFALYLMSKSFHKQFNRQLMCSSCHTITIARQGSHQSSGNTHVTSV